MTGEPSVLDSRTLDELRASIGGDQEFFAELIDEFLQDAPRQLAMLRESVASGDAEGARRASHTLKGTSRTFGAVPFAQLCQGVEMAASAGDLERLGPRLDELGVELDRVCAALASARGA